MLGKVRAKNVDQRRILVGVQTGVAFFKERLLNCEGKGHVGVHVKSHEEAAGGTSGLRRPAKVDMGDLSGSDEGNVIFNGGKVNSSVVGLPFQPNAVLFAGDTMVSEDDGAEASLRLIPSTQV